MKRSDPGGSAALTRITVRGGRLASGLRWLRCNLAHISLGVTLVSLAGIIVLDWPVIAALPALLLVFVVTDGIARPGSSVFYPTIKRGAASTRRVALSFDDGPDPAVTPRVLDVLAESGVHATFFVIGRSLAANPALGRRMLEEGHTLGNHSWHHSRWQNFFGTRRHLQEIDTCQRIIADVAGEPVEALYRPPVGLKSGELARAAWKRRLKLVAWSLHSHDTRLRDPGRIAHRVLSRVRAGDIVLLHDGHDLPGGERPHCVEAVRLIIRGLQEAGYECVTVPELLAYSQGGACRAAGNP